MTCDKVLSTTIWMRQGESFFLKHLDRLDDPELLAPSRLPGWNRAHVVAHVARNADALVRLLGWARTGVETPMYADPAQRTADISRGAEQPPKALRSDARTAATALDAAAAALPQPAWRAEVRTASGRVVPASEVLWMRVREVWLHAVDLGRAEEVIDLPPDLVEALLDDVTGAFDVRGDTPALDLRASDSEWSWMVHADLPGRVITGPAAELLAWLTGRSSGTCLRARPHSRPCQRGCSGRRRLALPRHCAR